MKILILICMVLRFGALTSGIKEEGFKKENIIYHVTNFTMLMLLLKLLFCL